MELSWEKFLKAYQEASADKQQIIDSEKIADCIEAQIEIDTIDKGQQKDVLLVTSHLLLETVSEIEAIGHLTKLGIPNANVIMEHLLECIGVADSAPTQPAQTPARVHSLADNMAAREEPRWGSEAPTYSSSQTALLNESERKTVQYTPPEPPQHS